MALDVILIATTLIVAVIGTLLKDPPKRVKTFLITLAALASIASIIKAHDDSDEKKFLRTAVTSNLTPDTSAYGRFNRVTVALKLAASNLRTSQSYLGAQFRRLRARLDTPVAIKAMAAKLARLIYRMLRYGTKYVDHGSHIYEAQQRTREIRRLKQKAANLGFQFVQALAA